MAGVAQLVERQVVVLDAVGSSPIARPSSGSDAEAPETQRPDRRPDRVLGLVLAGGNARRMGGGDKPLLEIAGQSMLALLLAAITPEVGAVAISANGDPARFADFGVPVLGDGEFAGRGPLAGVLAGLDWAASRDGATLLTVPGDAPFVPRGLAQSLSPAPACAASCGRIHPLVALWPVSAAPALREFLMTSGTRAAFRFAERIGMRRVDFPAAPFDPFLNVNTPEDLASARAVLATFSSLKPK